MPYSNWRPGANDRSPAGGLCFLISQRESLEPAVATIFLNLRSMYSRQNLVRLQRPRYGTARSQLFTGNDLVIEIEIAGDLGGRTLYGFSAEVIATLGGFSDDGSGFDAYSESLVQELAT